jgi:hypothetical protein
MSATGQSLPGLPAKAHLDVCYAPNCDQRIAAQRLVATGQ